MKKSTLKKRIIAIALSTILCLASTVTVFASSETNSGSSTSVGETTATSGGIAAYSIGSCIASDGVIANGYGCDLVLTLDKSYFDIYIRAGATGNSNNAVDCFVTFPDGTTYPLGFVVADGSKTSYLCYSGTAPAGNYTFSFEGTDSGTTGFLAFIYSSN